MTTTPSSSSQYFARLARLAPIVCALALTGLVTNNASAQGKASISTSSGFSAGVNVDAQPSVRDTGLPLYPGASVDREQRNDEKGVNLNAWFGDYGLKVVALKYKSDDSATRVETFYREALAVYGDVLDCSKNLKMGNTRSRIDDKEVSGKVLSCGDNKIKHSGRKDGSLYKSGTRNKQYAVFVQPASEGTTFQLVHFELRNGE